MMCTCINVYSVQKEAVRRRLLSIGVSEMSAKAAAESTCESVDDGGADRSPTYT